MKKETRVLSDPPALELREEGGKRYAVGYAAVYYRAGDAGTEYKLYDGMVERIRPGAFKSAMAEDDVRALFNHDTNQVLGRASAKTLKLTSDAKGLRYEIELPDTTTGRDVAELLKRGDVTGSSFSFALSPDGEKYVTEKAGDARVQVRWLESVRLYDVGPVTFPAYTGTTAGIRSADDAADVRAAAAQSAAADASRAAAEQAQDVAAADARRRQLEILSKRA